MSESNKRPKRRAKSSSHGGAHGGSWKVAYADFVTAMMAFFLLMWLLNAANPDQKAQLSGYFKDYSIFESGGSAAPPTADQPQTPSPPSTQEPQVIDITETVEPSPDTVDEPPTTTPDETSPDGTDPPLEKFRTELVELVAQKLADLKDQIIVDPFENGVRIQVVDQQDRPIFDLGGTTLTPPALEALKVIQESLNTLDNKISVEGHTDSLSYSSDRYTNWELSTDRASAARQQLEKFGLNPDRLLRVSGYAASDPLIKDNPQDPRNRRISILVYEKGKAGKSDPVRRTSGQQAPLSQDLGVSITSGQTSLDSQPPPAVTDPDDPPISETNE